MPYPGMLAHQMIVPSLTEHPPVAHAQVEFFGGKPVFRAPGPAVDHRQTAARIVGDREMRGIPTDIATMALEDDVLETVPISAIGEQVTGVVPPLDPDIVRSIIARQLDRDRRVVSCPPPSQQTATDVPLRPSVFEQVNIRSSRALRTQQIASRKTRSDR